MGQRPPAFRPPPRRRRRWLRRLAVPVFAAGVLAGGLLLARGCIRSHSLSWQVRRGLELLAAAETPARVLAALDRWEADMGPRWAARREGLIEHLLTACDLHDPRVRLLLTRVSGADYGARPDDWRRWYAVRAARRRGPQPGVPRGRGVSLGFRWSAPVGLTGWFTTILPLDGQIHVASLGTEFAAADDRADGVVRVDGRTGDSELLFAPPAEHRGPGDLVGLAAGGGGLLAAAYNGYVYALGRDGRLLWSAHAGAPIVGAPLALDVNGDGVRDALVVTRVGKVVALHGARGTALWVTGLAGVRGPDAVALGATLALGNVLGDSAPEVIVTTPAGQVELLAARTGRSLASRVVPRGTLAGALCRDGAPGAGPPACVADRDARVWSLVPAGRGVDLVALGSAAVRREESVVAGLRTLGVGPERPPHLLVCPTGDYAGGRGGLCALRPDGVEWRLDLGGAVWGTPAVADLNGDGRAEVVVATIEPAEPAGVVGVLTVVSADGHALWREVLRAPIESSPVVADVDGDSYLEILVADQAGELHCFGTRGYGPVEWGLSGGDSHNTRNALRAYAYGQVPCGLQWEWTPP